jgi:hypothetical protein
VVPVMLIVLAFLPRALYPVSRAWLWYLRAVHFWDALLAGDWVQTYQQYHPGVTTMWLSGAALKLFAWRNGLTSEQLLRVAPAQPGTFDAAATVGVLPLAFGLMFFSRASRIEGRPLQVVLCSPLTPF